MAIDHTFDFVASVEKNGSWTHIVLKDGTYLALPPAAIGEARIAPGDRVLLDFFQWNDGFGFAHLNIWRQHYNLLTSSIGKDQILSCPTLEEVAERT